MAAPQQHERRALRSQLLIGDLIGTVADTTGALVNGVGNTVGTAVNGVTNTVGNLPIVGPILSPVVTPIVAPIVAPLTQAPAPAPQPAPAPAPVTFSPTNAPAPAVTQAPAPKPTTASPSVTKAPSPSATSATETPVTETPTDAPTQTETPTVTDVTAGSLDVGKTLPFSVKDDSNKGSDDSNSNSIHSANFVSTTSDGTGHKTTYSPLSSSGSHSGSHDKDGSGASSIRTITGVGMSFGVAATLVAVIALIIYVRRERSRVQGKYKSDTFDPAELDSHRSDLDTAGSSYMTGNLTAMAGVKYLSSNTAWNDEELLVVRIPLESVVRGELISSGAFGEVYRGKFQHEDVAIKTLLPSKRKEIEEIKAFQAEIKLMVGLEHPRIVRFVGVAWESLSDLCVVTEFMAGGDLTSLLASFEASSPPRARGFDVDKVKIALHIAHALMYLHSLQPAVIHRDLKSKNVLLDAEWNAKVTDFGVSREQADETMTSGVGSSLWMAPEVTLGERYDEKADMFSFGVLLSELDTQLLPYSHARFEGAAEMIPQTTVLQLVSMGVMTIRLTESPLFEDMQQLARQCVELDPKARPTAAEALHRIHLAYSAALDDQSVTL